MTTDTPRLRLAIQNILSKPVSDQEKVGLLCDAAVAWLSSKEGLSTALLMGFEAGLREIVGNESDDGK